MSLDTLGAEGFFAGVTLDGGLEDVITAWAEKSCFDWLLEGGFCVY